MATVQFEYDPERLIHEVKKRPGIWDFEHIEYRTKNIRHRLWSEVVSKMMRKDEKMTKSEIRELELQLQKKWKSIRDYFQKYVTHPNRTKRPYLYARQLQFLLKNQETQQTQEGISSDSDTGRATIRAWKPRKKLKLTRESSEDDNDTIDNNDGFRWNEDISIETPIKNTNTHNKTIVDEFAFASVNTQNRNEQEDPDKLFLLSLLPHLKSIPEEFRLNVKMDMMQVLRNANYNMTTDHKVIM